MTEPPDPVAVDAQVARHQPRVIVTATSFPRLIEKLFRNAARARGIPSVMVLDADRTDLYRTEPDQIACRPDLAISIGDRMIAQLVAAGYDAARILTAGHLGLAPIAAAGRGIAEADAAAWKVSLRRRPPFRDRLNDRDWGLGSRRGDGKCPQVRLWAQVWRGDVGIGRGPRL